MYVFSSSLKVNSLRAEALFKLLPQSSLSNSPAPSPYADETHTAFPPDDPENVGDDGRSSTVRACIRQHGFIWSVCVSLTLSHVYTRILTLQQPVQGPRRSTRSTGDKKEDWIKIPVEASVSVEGSDPRVLDGFVYLSSENLRKCLSVGFCAWGFIFTNMNSLSSIVTNRIVQEMGVGVLRDHLGRCLL